MSNLITETDALSQGYAIDYRAPGRPIAYKGRLFAPTAVCGLYTDLEDTYRAALQAIVADPSLAQAVAAAALRATQH